MFKYSFIVSAALLAVALPALGEVTENPFDGNMVFEDDNVMTHMRMHNMLWSDMSKASQLNTHESQAGYGHFSDRLWYFEDTLYFQYVKTFDQPWQAKRDSDDPLNYAPSLDECSKLFKRIHVFDTENSAKSLRDFILLDACLGKIQYESTTKKAKESGLQPFFNRTDLEYLYASKFDEWLEQDKKCLRELFKDYFEVVKYNGKVFERCDLDWIFMYNKFADCRSDEWKSGKHELYLNDPYIKIIHTVVRTQSKECFSTTRKMMATKVLQLYNHERFAKDKYLPDSSWTRYLMSPVEKQSYTRKWPFSMIKVMQVFLNVKPKNEVDLNAVQDHLCALRNNKDRRRIQAVRDNAKKYFLPRLSNVKGMQTLAPEHNQMVVQERLCHAWNKIPYKPKKYFIGREKFNFYEHFEGMLNATRNADLFDYNQSKFIVDTLNGNLKSLYFTTIICKVYANSFSGWIGDGNNQDFRLAKDTPEIFKSWPILSREEFRNEREKMVPEEEITPFTSPLTERDYFETVF